MQIQTIHLPNDNIATAVLPDRAASPQELLDRLRIEPPRGVVILNGGTAQLAPPLETRLRLILADGMARVVAEEHLTVVTGGTDAGIFHLFGEGLARWGRTAPCIGVAVDALTIRPGHPQGEALLEPHHSHFVLVEGRQWGDETKTMYALAAALAHDCPSLAVFAGGGEIALDEMRANITQGRTMLLLLGSGRNTDAVLDAVAGRSIADARLAGIARYPGIVPVPIEAGPAELRNVLGRLLFSQTNENP